MNSGFVHELAGALAKSVDGESGGAEKIRGLYRKVLAREPTSKELDLAMTYLGTSLSPVTVEQYAQVLLSTNEEIFWP